MLIVRILSCCLSTRCNYLLASLSGFPFSVCTLNACILLSYSPASPSHPGWSLYPVQWPTLASTMHSPHSDSTQSLLANSGSKSNSYTGFYLFSSPPPVLYTLPAAPAAVLCSPSCPRSSPEQLSDSVCWGPLSPAPALAPTLVQVPHRFGFQRLPIPLCQGTKLLFVASPLTPWLPLITAHPLVFHLTQLLQKLS